MQRLLTITVDLSNYSLSSSGDNEFFYGDNNQIQVILKNKEENETYIVNMSGNPRGVGSYIATLPESDDGSYILSSDDFSGFLLTVGTVLCNIHITNSKNEKITTVTFKLASKMASDRNSQTVISQSDVKTLADVYEAADFLDSLNVQEIEDAVKIVESLDIDAINQAIEIVDELDEKSAEIDKTLADAKVIETELNNTVTDVNQKLAAGAFNGKDGNPGQNGTYITNVTINASSHLIVSLSDGTNIDAGAVSSGVSVEQGKDGRGISNIVINSSYEMIVTYTDETTKNLGNVRGPEGPSGTPGGKGDPGFSPTARVEAAIDGAVVTITDQSGTTKATIKNGADGVTPVRGVDYWTSADKTEIENDLKNYVDTEIIGGTY